MSCKTAQRQTTHVCCEDRQLLEEKATMLSVLQVETQQENDRLRKALEDIASRVGPESKHWTVVGDGECECVAHVARAALKEAPDPAGDREWADGH